MTAEEKPDEKPGNAERLNKLLVARNNTRGMLIVAAISGLISVSVSLVTFWSVKQQLLVEDSLERAKIFQNLVETVRTSNDPTYALLALWKVFPEDEKLIVMTAMMNPTPQSVSTLHAIGLTDRLDSHNKNIFEMMIHAPRELRQEYSNAYRNISPQTVLNVLVETAIRSRGGEREMSDLKNLLDFNPDMLTILLDKIAKEDRVQDNTRLHLRIARMVYDSDPAPLRDLLATSKGDVTLFHQISQELFNHLDRLTPDDQDIMMDLALVALTKISQGPDLERKTGDIVDLFTALTATIEPTTAQRQKLSDALEQIYTRKAKRGVPDTLILKAVNRFSPSAATAQSLFLTTLACVAKEDLLVFHYSFPVEDLAMVGWNEDLGFDASRDEAKRRVATSGEECSTW